MGEVERLTEWIDGYLRAWNSNDPADIGALFTDDAAYFTAPFRPPWRGRDAIIEGWLDRKDEPGETTFEWKPVVVTADVAVIEGTTTYPTELYRNLWIIRLDADGRCREFSEWWMQDTASATAPD